MYIKNYPEVLERNKKCTSEYFSTIIDVLLEEFNKGDIFIEFIEKQKKSRFLNCKKSYNDSQFIYSFYYKPIYEIEEDELEDFPDCKVGDCVESDDIEKCLSVYFEKINNKCFLRVYSESFVDYYQTEDSFEYFKHLQTLLKIENEGV